MESGKPSHFARCVTRKGEETMKTKQPNTNKQLVVRVPEEVHRALKVRAAEKGKSVAVIVEGLIREYLVKGESHA